MRVGLASEGDSLNEWKNDGGFNRQLALERIGAHFAYGVGGVVFNGSGVTVAVVADGVWAGGNKTALQDEDGNPLPIRVSEFTHPDINNGAPYDVGDVERDCGAGVASTDTTCWGTQLATLMVGNVSENYDDPDVARLALRDLRGLAPGAELLDVPFNALWDYHCKNHITVSCGRTGDNDALQTSAETYATVLGVAMNAAAVDHATPARYIHVHYSDPGDGAGRYLPIYTGSQTPTGNNRDYLEHLMDTLGAAVWQNGPPASGEDTRSVFVVPAGNDHHESDRDSEWRRTCTNFNGGTSPRSCDPGSGNYADNPRIYAMLPRIAQLVGTSTVPRSSDLTATFLAVVGLDSTPDATGQYPIRTREDTDHGPPSDSNYCGAAQAWCLAAPSENIKTYWNRQIITEVAYDTSYAAALVTGALAIMDQAFNDEGESVAPVAVRKRLLDTADRTGIYANANIYGWGALDLVEALSVQGSTTTPAPPSLPGGLGHVQGPGHATRGMALALPASVRAALDGTTMMVLDSQGFPFRMGLGRIAREPVAVVPLFTTLAAQRPPMYAGGLGISAGQGQGGWSSALVPQHLLHGHGGAPFAHGGRDAGWRQAGGLAAGSHLAVSPLMASTLDSGGTRHLAVRARFGSQTLGAMACTQQRGGAALDGGAETRAGSCMALGWDWAAGPGFGLSVRTHRLDSRGGLYRYGLRCFGAACGEGGGASATELGLGGFAMLARGLRLGWNWWRGWADDQDGGATLHYRGMGHSAGSIALEDPRGRWSLYVQQPLRTQGTLQLVLPQRRDPAGNVYFRSHQVSLDGVARPLRLGLSGRLALARSGGFVAVDLGSQRGLDGAAGAHPYLSLEARIPW